MKKSRPSALYLEAAQAAKALNIRKETLYAYVSRGQLRSIEVPGQKGRYYLREEVEKLQQKKRLRQQPNTELQQALHWGAPLLHSDISHLREGHLYYRHQRLDSLSTASLESLIALLWNCPALAHPGAWQQFSQHPSPQLSPVGQIWQLVPQGSAWFYHIQIALNLWFAQDLSVPVSESPVSDAARILWRIWSSLTHWAQTETSLPPGAPRQCIDCFKPLLPDPAQQELARLILILSAEHELNVSSFTARCVASGRGNVYQSLSAAFAALGTPRQGGQVLQVQHFLRQHRGQTATQMLQNCRLSGIQPPMPGHPLYPEGDPRWQLFEAHVSTHWSHHPRVQETLTWIEVLQQHQPSHPTLDWVLALGAELLCPQWLNALDWFALGRCVGWLAHIQEQWQHPHLIRPRGQGAPPPPSADTA